MATTLAEAVVMIFGNSDRLEKDLDGAEKKTESAVGNMTKWIGGALVGAAAAAGAAIFAIGKTAFDVATDIDSATDQIGASLGITADEAAKFGDVIKAVYGDNFGDSIEDVGSAVEQVAKQLKLAADDPALPKLTSNAFRLRDVFKVEISGSVNAAKTLMDNFGISSEEAFNMLAMGYQRGLDSSGDFLDTIGEYSVQFAEGGASAVEFFSLMDSGLQGGVLGTDKAADAFKEFGIRIKDSSDLTIGALADIDIDYAKLTKGFTEGSTDTVEAMQEVIFRIQAIADPMERARLGVALFGTQWEDLGEKAIFALDITEDWAEGGIKDIAIMDTKYTNLGSVIEGMWRKFQVGIAPAGELMLKFVNDNLPAIQGVVNSVSGGIVTVVGLIPIVIANVRKKWEEDFGGMRKAAENFMTLAADFEVFWDRVNKAFDEGGESNEESWAEFLAGTTNIFTSWVRVTLETLGVFFDNWRNTQNAWSALMSGDWSTFWSSIGANFENVMNGLLNYVEFVFNVDLRNFLVQGMTDAWDGMKGIWEDISEWWNSTFGSLLGGFNEGMSSAGRTNSFTPEDTRAPWEKIPIVAPGSEQPLQGFGGTTNSKSIVVESGGITISGVADSAEGLAYLEDALIAILERSAN